MKIETPCYKCKKLIKVSIGSERICIDGSCWFENIQYFKIPEDNTYFLNIKGNPICLQCSESEDTLKDEPGKYPAGMRAQMGSCLRDGPND